MKTILLVFILLLSILPATTYAQSGGCGATFKTSLNVISWLTGRESYVETFTVPRLQVIPMQTGSPMCLYHTSGKKLGCGTISNASSDGTFLISITSPSEQQAMQNALLSIFGLSTLFDIEFRTNSAALKESIVAYPENQGFMKQESVVGIPYNGPFFRCNHTWTSLTPQNERLFNGYEYFNGTGKAEIHLNLNTLVTDSSASIRFNLSNDPTLTNAIALGARVSANSEYSARISNSTRGNFVAIYKKVNGVTTVLSYRPVNVSEGKLGFEVKGSRLRAYLNDVLLSEVNDSSVTAAGKVSIWGFNRPSFSHYLIENAPAQ